MRTQRSSEEKNRKAVFFTQSLPTGGSPGPTMLHTGSLCAVSTLVALEGHRSYSPPMAGRTVTGGYPQSLETPHPGQPGENSQQQGSPETLLVISENQHLSCWRPICLQRLGAEGHPVLAPQGGRPLDTQGEAHPRTLPARAGLGILGSSSTLQFTRPACTTTSW